MAVARVQKMVLITVYEVKPRRRRLSFSKNHHARLRPSHQHSGGAYNRRAELLQYCQQLRAHGHQIGTTSRAIPRNQHTSNKACPSDSCVLCLYIRNLEWLLGVSLNFATIYRLFQHIAIRVNTRNSRVGPDNIGRGCCCRILF